LWWGDHCNNCNHSKKQNSNHLSVHQWIRSAIRDSQLPTSPIGFLFWNFRHRLARYYWYDILLFIKLSLALAFYDAACVRFCLLPPADTCLQRLEVLQAEVFPLLCGRGEKPRTLTRRQVVRNSVLR
jgi:hypothetical protein